MAPHHVRLRRRCPSLFGPVTPSPGAGDRKRHPPQAEGAVCKMRYCFSPWERLTTERVETV
jgi:hypothetical protein